MSKSPRLGSLPVVSIVLLAGTHAATGSDLPPGKPLKVPVLKCEKYKSFRVSEADPDAVEKTALEFVYPINLIVVAVGAGQRPSLACGN